jgi:phosphoribosylamine--glycine ligase
MGDSLEQDRAVGQQALRDLGLATLDSHRFDSFDDAIAFVERTRARHVLKFNGSGWSPMRSYVGMRDDGRDMLGVLAHQRDRWSFDHRPDFILMDFAHGVEVGVGAYFDGTRFLSPPNLDWEHKRFFNGDLGELTGEMGTVVTYRGADRLFDATLGRLAPRLAAAGHRGYVNLNTIVNGDGIWPLELTCRFGYPGYSILDALHAEPWDRILTRIADGGGTSIDTLDGYAVGVVLTVPPFPYSDGYPRLSKGVPVHVPADASPDDLHHLHYAEVALRDGRLVTAGSVGYVMVATGRGPTIVDAQRAAYRLAGQIAIPNVRYRTDIGDKLVGRDHAELARLGWLA